MKKIKSATIGNDTLELKSYQGIYYIVHNDLPVTNSVEYNYVDDIFNKFLKQMKEN